MFLRSQKQWKNGKPHRYFSVVENRRVAVPSPKASKVVQRTVPYLGEVNDSQQAAWRKTLEVFDESSQQTHPLSLFPEDRPIPPDALHAVQVKRSEMRQAGTDYLVGTPRSLLSQLEPSLAELPWQEARPDLRVQWLPKDGEVYVLAQSPARRAMARRRQGHP